MANVVFMRHIFPFTWQRRCLSPIRAAVQMTIRQNECTEEIMTNEKRRRKMGIYENRLMRKIQCLHILVLLLNAAAHIRIRHKNWEKKVVSMWMQEKKNGLDYTKTRAVLAPIHTHTKCGYLAIRNNIKRIFIMYCECHYTMSNTEKNAAIESRPEPSPIFVLLREQKHLANTVPFKVHIVVHWIAMMRSLWLLQYKCAFICVCV